MTSYYVKKKLAGDRLQQCYEVAPPRVRQYLESEIQHLLDSLHPADRVLELGCGYGRVSLRIADIAERVVGIDVAEESLSLARQLARSYRNCEFLSMDARDLKFEDASFDVVACIQNGVCAFGIDQETMLREAWRILRPSGLMLLSTYTPSFWPERLRWFEIQAEHGLIGELDRAECRDGTIVCTDGFRSGCVTRARMDQLGAMLGVPATLVEVDRSSLWCELRKPAPR
jgi:SAM-dependent methyltransferase